MREIIAQFELQATKSLGQNFLLDLNLTAKIARGAGDLNGRTVMEIGPGPGGLTRALLATEAREVIAVEFDSRAVAALESLQQAHAGRLTILHQDALRTDCTTLGNAPRTIVANLPYNIATPLLIGWLKQMADDPGAFESLTLMFQREVAERIVAKPGGKTYGRLAVMTGWLAEAKILFDIPPQAFTPPPKVVSTVVRIVPRTSPFPGGEVDRRAGEGIELISPLTLPSPPGRGEISFATMEKVVAAAFGQRRKMLRASLKTLGGDTDALLATAGIEPTARAETIDVAGFIRLAEAYANR